MLSQNDSSRFIHGASLVFFISSVFHYLLRSHVRLVFNYAQMISEVLRLAKCVRMQGTGLLCLSRISPPVEAITLGAFTSLLSYQGRDAVHGA